MAVLLPEIAINAPIIEATDLSKTYRSDGAEVHALRGLTLTVNKGEMVSIMGPSGCGKTTLLNCLSGLDTIDHGVIRIEGHEIQRLSDDAKTNYRAQRMGFIFQFFNLLPVLSAEENVELPLLLAGVSSKEARERAQAALATVDLQEWAAHRPAQLSGGQQQRVTVARALVNNPAIVWADEPTGNLDSSSAAGIMDLIVQLNNENAQTFVIVTHDASVGERCHRTVLIRDGQIEGETQHRALGQ